MAAPLNPLAVKMAALWDRNKPIIRERLDLLQRAITQFEENGSIEPELRTAAIEVAHKLAGSLGMFGHTAATDSARAIEIELETNNAPDKALLRQHLETLTASLSDSLQ